MSSGNDNMTDLNVDPKILNPEGAGELENDSPELELGRRNGDGDGVGGDMAGDGVDITPDRITALLTHLMTLYVAYLAGAPPQYDSVYYFIQAFTATSFNQLMSMFPEIKLPTAFQRFS